MRRSTAVGLLAAIASVLGPRPTPLFAEQAARSIKLADAPESGPAARKGKSTPPRRAPPFSVKVLVDETTMHAKQASLSFLTIASANRIAMHKHPGAEVLYVKKGRARVVGPRGVTPAVLPTGSAILIPGGMPHAIENMVRTAPVEILQVFAPPGPERVYRDPRDSVGRAAFEIVRTPKQAVMPRGMRWTVTSFEKAHVYPQPGKHADARLLFDPGTSDSAAVAVAALELDPKADLSLPTSEDAAAILYILSGGGEIRIGDDRVKFGADQAIHVPADQRPAAKIRSRESTVAIVIYAPAGPEQEWKPDTAPATTTKDGPHLRTETPATTVPNN